MCPSPSSSYEFWEIMGGKSWKVDTSYDDVYDNNAFEMDRVQYFKIAGAKRGIGTRCDLQ